MDAAETAVTEARRHAMGGAGSWTLTAQIAFAEARAGRQDRLAVSRDAFAAALRLRPGDATLLAQSGWIWLESGDAVRARLAAEQAIARDPQEWREPKAECRSCRRDSGSATRSPAACRAAPA